MMIRLKDLAQESGVSIRTVSRVLNGAPHISTEKAARVNDAVRKLGYSPNLIARGLRTKRTHLLGIIGWDLIPQVNSKKLAGLQMEAANAGYQTLFGLTSHESGRERTLLQLYQRICDGIMLLNPPSPENLDLIRSLSVPALLIGYTSDFVPCIRIDRKQGILEAFSLVALSYSHIVFLTASDAPQEERLVAFNHAMDTTGHAGRATVVHVQSNQYDGGYSSGDAISHLKPALVVCYNDQLAIGLMKRLYELSVRIPEEIGVIGFDNDDATQYSYKALSSVHQSVGDLAKAAIGQMDRMVQERIAGAEDAPRAGRAAARRKPAGNGMVLDTIKSHFIARQTAFLAPGARAASRQGEERGR